MEGLKDNFDYFEEKDLFSIKDAFMKYIKYWPFFLGMTLFSILVGFLYIRYSPVTYLSTTKIKILDDTKELDIAKDPSTLLWSDSKINMDNEIAILKSYRLLSQVVTSLNLDISYYYKGTFKTTEIWDQPFVIRDHIMPEDFIHPIGFKVKLLANGFHIIDDDGKEYSTEYSESGTTTSGLPFNIALLEEVDLSHYDGVTYQVVISPKKDAVMNLLNQLQVQPTNKKSEILTLWLVSESAQRSEDILNTTIQKFNEDGIIDRQIISKRTLDFLDERFLYLSGELDSIEAGKQGFKQENSLSNIEEDATTILRKKSIAEDEVFDLETQITLSDLLRSSVVKEEAYNLLPSDIGLENNSINNLVSEYNELALDRSKLIKSVGINHPTLQGLNTQLESAKQNILKTINVYRRQLSTSLRNLNQQKNLADNMFSRLPEKEKMLRSIERQQSIKEKLFLLLLQKREEAAVNYAVTAPSIKVVDYGLTQKKPISPKKLIVYSICLFLGLAIPFSILYLRYILDNKVHNRNDVITINQEIPFMGEIPFFEENHRFFDSNDRSVLAESYRILSTNINHHLKNNATINEGKVIFITSSTKGEGKTLTALNLSLAYASLKKKVLLVGGDLRNPKLASYLRSDGQKGLSEYLLFSETEWTEIIKTSDFNNNYHSVCFSGKIPTNPSELLAGDAFNNFIKKAKQEFDFIVVDTAPTILVSDTFLISQAADLTLFMLRANFTDKKTLKFSKDIFIQKKLKNMVYALNAVDNRNKEYNYGYEYGYANTDSYQNLNKNHIVYTILKRTYEKIISISTKTINEAKKLIIKK